MLLGPSSPTLFPYTTLFRSIPDVLDDPEYSYGDAQKTGGFRTVLGVPLMREGAAIGVLVLARSAVRPFTAQQIELVETFARSEEHTSELQSLRHLVCRLLLE